MHDPIAAVILDPTERNPERDIVPPHHYLVQVGLLPPNGPPTHTDTAFVYFPDGRCVGTLSSELMLALEGRYYATKAQHPSRHAQLATTFPQDLAQCLLRHRPTPASSNLKSSDHWTCPDHLISALSDAFGMTEERFSSPMDHHPALPSHWTAHPEDSLFGANHDAFSTPWAGCSLAHPGLSAEHVNKALRWALASATIVSAPPTCTIMVLPVHLGDIHMKLLRQPEVTILAHVSESAERSNYLFKPPFHWQGHPMSPLQGAPEHPKHPMIIAAVCNAAGKELYLSEERTVRFHQLWGRGAPTHLDKCLPQDPVTELKGPRALDRLLNPSTCIDAQPPPPGGNQHLPQKQATARLPPIPCPTGPATGTYPCTYPLSLPPDSLLVYTDGSCIRLKDGPQVTGAAVFCIRPPGDDSGRPTIFKVNPNGRTYTNTINRAELSAILKALITDAIAATSETMHLFTDSLCAIQLISQILDTPWRLNTSKHLDLLENIVAALRARTAAGARTHFYKVRAHASNSGNNTVDKAAKEAALDDTRADH